jgi:hypothetical protein
MATCVRLWCLAALLVVRRKCQMTLYRKSIKLHVYFPKLFKLQATQNMDQTLIIKENMTKK